VVVETVEGEAGIERLHAPLRNGAIFFSDR
jgi:hypothetical protein